VPDAIEAIVGVYESERQDGEPFIETVRRVGLSPFKAAFKELSHVAD
jgi:sulfite reductase (NADPH) hemoprotein beta-component